MTTQPAWTGNVDSSLENGQATGLQLKKGDSISVLAKGYIKFGPDDTEWSDPESPIPTHKTTFERNPALVATIGNDKTRYPIGNGVFDWNVPADGELIFLFIDAPGEYGDNKGAFNVTVMKEAPAPQPQPKPIAWNGQLMASALHGAPTGVSLSKGDVISIAVTGAARYEADRPEFGPDGDPSLQGHSLLPTANVGAVLMTIGGGPYTLVGSGLTNYIVPYYGEIIFYYNTGVAVFPQASGSFQITLTGHTS